MKHQSIKNMSAKQVAFLVIRLLLAVVFIFSGFVKLIDPLGFAYKIEDYLIAFGSFFVSFTPLALPASIALSTFEMVLGLCLLFRIHIRYTALFTFLFMCVMTALTLYTFIANPVSDCGCFGDAVILSNSATFYKNVVLLALTILFLIYAKQLKSTLSPIKEWGVLAFFVVIGVALSIYCLAYLPLIDFRPYKVGTDIQAAMSIPDGAKGDVYETTFIYEKDGVQQEFTLENYPKNDSTWVFVDQKNVLISKGDTPAITDFSIFDAYYDDITYDVLNYDEGNVYLLVMYDVNKASEKGAIYAEKIYKEAEARGDMFLALTASSESDIEMFVRKTGVTYPFFATDPITLKTIVRSNPGLLLLNKGKVMDKWSWRELKSK